MKIEAKIESMLKNNGLWPNEAKAITAELKTSMKEMNGRWEEDETAYPPQLMAVIWMSAKSKAIERIDSNKPKHFARFMLTSE